MYIYPTAAEYICFSSTHERVSMINPNIGQEISHSKFRKVKIMPSIFSDHNGMKLEINIKRKNWKIYRHVEIKQHSPEKPMGQRNWKRNVKKKYWERNENGHTTHQNLWDTAKVVLSKSL